MQLTKDDFLKGLARAAYAVSVQNLFLTDDSDAPISPESLVQIVVAQSLKDSFPGLSIGFESSTSDLESEFSKEGNISCERQGSVDIVCRYGSEPLAVIEVKYQLTGTNDGLVSDVVRLQQLLALRHRFFPKYRFQFGGIVSYVTKSATQYEPPKYFDHEFERYAGRSVKTVEKNIKAALNATSFDIAFLSGRCVDSSKDGEKPDDLVGTEFEDEISGAERMTKYLVAVISHRHSQ